MRYLALSLIFPKLDLSIFSKIDIDCEKDRSLVIIPKAEKTEGKGGIISSAISNSSKSIGPISGPQPPKAKREKSLGSRPRSNIISFIADAVFEIKTFIIEIAASAVSILSGMAIFLSIASFANASATSILPPIKFNEVIYPRCSAASVSVASFPPRP